MENLDTVLDNLQKLLVDFVNLLAKHIAHTAFVAIVKEDRAFNGKCCLLIILNRLVVSLVGRAFAKSLRSHTEFKVVLGKAKAVQLVTELNLVPKLEVAFFRCRLSALCSSLVPRICLSGFDQAFPCERACDCRRSQCER